MITKLTIENFKSIKSLTMDCKRVNVFIGEPNAGKSNILEALGLLNWCEFISSNVPLRDYIRFESPEDLFYDQLLNNAVLTQAEGDRGGGVRITSANDNFLFEWHPVGRPGAFEPLVRLNCEGEKVESFSGLSQFTGSRIKFYLFREQNQFPGRGADSLTPPHGGNLFSLVNSSQRFRELMQSFFEPYGLTLVLRRGERKFAVQKQAKPVVVNFPYDVTPDTLRRAIFYTMAMASNRDATLVLEEPESHAFPYFTKHLGESIGMDDSNQYFIATHNPYLLSAIVEKGKRDELNVAITYLRDYQTEVKCLAPEQLDELLDADPFFNLKSFIEEEAHA